MADSRNFLMPTTLAIAGIVVAGAAMSGMVRNGTLPIARKPIQTKPASFLPEATGTRAPGGTITLQDLDTQFANLVETIEPSVVHIQVRGKNGQPAGQGSGVIYREDGYIITNDHVVSLDGDVYVILSSGKEYKGKVTRSGDARNDVAVVKIEAKGLPAAPFADSRNVRPGQYAIAVGAPFGLENTVTIGHISALGRASAAGGGSDIRVYNGMIQTDAPINPGNSGGPLLNINGEVVGINTSIYSTSAMMGEGQNAGIGFSLPSNQVKFIADELISRGKLMRGYLGVLPETLKPYEKDELGVSKGAILRQVPADGPAAKAGLKANDIITRVGNMEIVDDQDILNSMLRNAPGTSVSVEYIRDGKRGTATVKVGEFPKENMTAPRNQGQNGPRFYRGNPEDMEKFFNNVPDELKDFFNEGQPAPEETPKAPAAPSGKPRLGVSVTDISTEARAELEIPKGLNGAFVGSVEPGSLADRLGLKEGDVITRLNGKTVKSAAELVEIINSVKSGQSGDITFQRFTNGTSMSQSRSGFKF